MDVMGIVIALLIGAVAGWLAGLVMGGRGGLLRNIILGIIGSVVGTFLLGLIGIHGYGLDWQDSGGRLRRLRADWRRARAVALRLRRATDARQPAPPVRARFFVPPFCLARSGGGLLLCLAEGATGWSECLCPVFFGGC